MRVAEVVSTFPPYHGGMGYVCFHNAEELARRGHDVTVFTLEHHRLSYEKDPENLRIVRLRTPLIYGDGGMVPCLYSELRGFEIIHLHYPFYGGAEYVYLASLLRGQKYFLTYHMDVYGNNLLKRLILGIYEPLLTKRIIRKAALVGALNLEHLRGSKAARFVDWGKVVEVPNGVDAGVFRPRERDDLLMERYGLRGKVVVLFVGNLQPFKGLHLLIDAMAGIRDENIVLLVVGGGYSEDRYREQTRQRKIENRVIFAGPKSPGEDLPDHYNLCDILVLPSTHSEAFPLVVLEAMASGKPVIVSSLPGPAQLVDDGKDGLVARAGDVDDLRSKIMSLAGEGERCRQMGESGRRKVLAGYTWEKIGERLEKTLAGMLEN